MSTTLELDDDFDLVVEENNFKLITGPNALVQRLETNLQCFAGEWFLDQNLGIPYFQQIFRQKKQIDIGAIASVFREAILDTEGVRAIQSLELDFEDQTRQLSVTFRVDATDATIEETINISV